MLVNRHKSEKQAKKNSKTKNTLKNIVQLDIFARRRQDISESQPKLEGLNECQ